MKSHLALLKATLIANIISIIVLSSTYAQNQTNSNQKELSHLKILTKILLIVFPKLINLILQTRQQQVQINWLQNKLEKAENSGFASDSKEQILNQSKSLFHG